MGFRKIAKYVVLTLCVMASGITVASSPSVPQMKEPLMDSDQLVMEQIAPAKMAGFVLATGAYTLYCGKGNKNCDYKVSSQRCPPGYTARVATAVVDTGSSSSCAINHIYLQPQPVTPIAYGDGYKLHFSSAYAAGSTFFCSNYQVTINYSIYCS